jgi:hypothetical protein
VGTICDITKNGYIGTAIDPSDIVGGAALDHHFSPEHAHAAEPLSYGAFYSDFYFFIYWPDTTAYSVLTISQYVKVASALPDSLLYLLFKDP